MLCRAQDDAHLDRKEEVGHDRPGVPDKPRRVSQVVPHHALTVTTVKVPHAEGPKGQCDSGVLQGGGSLGCSCKVDRRWVAGQMSERTLQSRDHSQHLHRETLLR